MGRGGVRVILERFAYAFVNFGMAQDGKLKAATAKYQAAREKKQESKVAVAAATDPELPLLPQRTLQLPAEAAATVFMEMDDDDSGTLDRVEVAKLLVHHLRNIIIMIGTLDWLRFTYVFENRSA
jgi:hypothetical protein|eukprot:COSAG01_NODE_6939_length_3431_cov_3.279712_1_plen_125_part_00